MTALLLAIPTAETDAASMLGMGRRPGMAREGTTAARAGERTRGAAMAKFMDVHRGFVGLSADQLKQAHQADLAIESEEGVHFERAWLDPASGAAFCLSTGPTMDAVKRVHERSGHPADEIHQVDIEVA